MYPHDELYHYGTKGMRWGVRKSPGEKASNFQRKSDQAAKQVGEIALRARKDSAGNTYMTRKDVSKANRLIRKSQKYAVKAKKYQKLDAETMKKTLKKPLPKRDQARHLSTFQKTMLSIGTGVAVGGILAPLARPTADHYGKAIRDKVLRKDDILKLMKNANDFRQI